MHAIVSATETSSISGTAMRSAPATARGPRTTMIVATTPRTIAQTVSDPTPTARAQADAAITLFSAIHAKFEMYRTTATMLAPRMPSAGRVATIDGTRSRDPSGASAATRAAPPMLPIVMRTTVAFSVNEAARLAPTWKVVATMFAPTKIRNRSKIDWVWSISATGRIPADSTGGGLPDNYRR